MQVKSKDTNSLIVKGRNTKYDVRNQHRKAEVTIQTI